MLMCEGCQQHLLPFLYDLLEPDERQATIGASGKLSGVPEAASCRGSSRDCSQRR